MNIKKYPPYFCRICNITLDDSNWYSSCKVGRQFICKKCYIEIHAKLKKGISTKVPWDGKCTKCKEILMVNDWYPSDKKRNVHICKKCGDKKIKIIGNRKKKLF